MYLVEKDREFERCTIDPNEEEAFFVPRDTRCPKECQFSQPLARDRCSKVCVPAESCEDFHPARPFGDPTVSRS